MQIVLGIIGCIRFSVLFYHCKYSLINVKPINLLLLVMIFYQNRNKVAIPEGY